MDRAERGLVTGKVLASDQVQRALASVQTNLERDILSGKIPFPYRSSWSESPNACMARFRSYVPKISPHPYRLRAFHPQYKLVRSPLFRCKFCCIVSEESTIDVLSDLFQEPVRMLAYRPGYPSPYDAWKDPKIIKVIATKAKNSTPQELRKALYNTIPEAKPFRMTWVKGLATILQLENRNVLDISAGWGDRLLASMGLGWKYTGYDPNRALESGHTRMIEMFGHPSRHKVFHEPFESANIQGEYDLILSSPPFFDIEIYTQDNSQSVIQYPEFETWMKRFLFASLRKAWNNLSPGGSMVLHLGDSNRYSICEPVLLFVGELEGSVFEGVIGLSSPTGDPRPVWVWKKGLGECGFVRGGLVDLYPQLA